MKKKTIILEITHYEEDDPINPEFITEIYWEGKLMMFGKIKFVFHGTNSYYLKEIREEGLLSPRILGRTNWENETNIDLIYFMLSESNAKMLISF